MKVGIFGGSFDPIHKAHFQLAEQSRKQFHLDSIFWIASFGHPFKNNQHATFSDRMRMLELFLEPYPFHKPSDMESSLERERPVYTVQVLQSLVELYPAEVDWFFLIGSDNLLQLPFWYKYEKLLSMVNLIVYPRPGYDMKDSSIPHFELSSSPIEISSSEIRKKIREKQPDWDFHLSAEIREYIMTNRLYGFDPDGNK